MKPQPPVTRIRTATASSAQAGALADFPMLSEQLETWQRAIEESNWTPWLIIGLATFLRFFLLGMKPPHFDEGINGWFVDQIVKTGFYKYDPTNYHGPLHFYVLLLSQTLFGRNLWALRLPVVLVSIGCVWLTLKFEPFVGRTASRLAALAMAISPGFVFYGRYSIHEVWILFFTILFFYGLLGLWKFGTPKYLWCVGMGFTGMILSKETYVLHVGCALIAAGVCYVSNFFNQLEDPRPVKQTWNYVDLAVVIGTGIALIVTFYSGFFFHWTGVRGIFEAYKPWFETGSQGHGHEKSWPYWLKLIARYEWPTLGGLILCLFAIRFKDMALRYLAIYGVGTLMAYSIVKYKTPWCIISFIWPFAFIFGAATLIIPEVYRKIAWLVSAVLLTGSFGYCIWLNYFRCSTDSEPYVYVQTYNDIYKFTDPIMRLAHADPRAYQLVGHIIRGSPYPLPWILGDFVSVGYYEKDNAPEKLDGDFLLVQQDRIAEIEKKLHDSYYTVMLTIRPYQDPSKAYFTAKRFKAFFPERLPDFTGSPSQPTPTPSPNQ